MTYTRVWIVSTTKKNHNLYIFDLIPSVASCVDSLGKKSYVDSQNASVILVGRVCSIGVNQMPDKQGRTVALGCKYVKLMLSFEFDQ